MLPVPLGVTDGANNAHDTGRPEIKRNLDAFCNLISCKHFRLKIKI